MAEHCVNSIAALKALGAGVVPCLTVLGYYAPGDGGGGSFYWDASATENDNGGTIIVPVSNPPTGRWKRIYSAPLNVRWFGAKGDVATDNAAFQAAVAAVLSNPLGGTLYIPAGTYELTRPLEVGTLAPKCLRIYGDGRATTLNFMGTGPEAQDGLVANTTYNVWIEDIRITGSVSVAVFFAGQSSTANRGPCGVRRCYFDNCCTHVPETDRIIACVAFSGIYGIDEGWLCDNEFIGNGVQSAALDVVVSAGTFPPPVTLTGTPSGVTGGVVLEITTGGARGTAVFKWSADNGVTFTTGVTTAASVVLGSSGMTANFAAGPYSTDNVYSAVFFGAEYAYIITAFPNGGSYSRLHCIGNRIAATWAVYGILLYDTDYSEVYGNTIDMGGALNRGPQSNDHSGYGVTVYSTSIKGKYRNRIQDNTISNCAGMGIYVQANYDFAIVGNVLFNTAINQPAASLDAATISCDVGSGTIVGNMIKASGHYGIATEGNYYTIAANRIDGCVAGVFLDNATNYASVVGNQISGCARGLYSDPSGTIQKCTFVGNTVNDSSYIPIDLYGATDCSISGNQVDTAGAGHYGIHIDAANTRCIVSDNGVSGVSNAYAIAINAANSQVRDNIVSTSTNGILSSGNGCTITGNDVSAVSGTALTITGTGSVASANWTAPGVLTGGPTITGSRGSNAALASLLTQLAAVGQIVDTTTS